MAENPLASLNSYSRFVAELLGRPAVSRSTLIKHHRVPAPETSFTRPNLPWLIREIEALIEKTANELESK